MLDLLVSFAVNSKHSEGSPSRDLKCHPLGDTAPAWLHGLGEPVPGCGTRRTVQTGAGFCYEGSKRPQHLLSRGSRSRFLHGRPQALLRELPAPLPGHAAAPPARPVGSNLCQKGAALLESWPLRPQRRIMSVSVSLRCLGVGKKRWLFSLPYK